MACIFIFIDKKLQGGTNSKENEKTNKKTINK
jgi:hypothetical protein